MMSFWRDCNRLFWLGKRLFKPDTDLDSSAVPCVAYPVEHGLFGEKYPDKLVMKRKEQKEFCGLLFRQLFS
jgi:hypothetical protein